MSRPEVMAALGDADPAKVEIAAKAMGDHCSEGDYEEARKAYATAGGINTAVKALLTHTNHVGAQEQLCYALERLACRDAANQACVDITYSSALLPKTCVVSCIFVTGRYS